MFMLFTIVVSMFLLFRGIVWALRRPKYRRLQAADFPGVPGDKFEEWRRLELMSINIFLWAALGLLVIGIPLAIFILGPLTFGVRGFGETCALLGAFMLLFPPYLLLLLVGLTICAIYGSKAKRLKKSLGIQWPREG